MTRDRAFEIILDLARGNVLTDGEVEGDERLKDEQYHQREALRIVESIVGTEN